MRGEELDRSIDQGEIAVQIFGDVLEAAHRARERNAERADRLRRYRPRPPGVDVQQLGPLELDQLRRERLGSQREHAARCAPHRIVRILGQLPERLFLAALAHATPRRTDAIAGPIAGEAGPHHAGVLLAERAEHRGDHHAALFLLLFVEASLEDRRRPEVLRPTDAERHRTAVLRVAREELLEELLELRRHHHVRDTVEAVHVEIHAVDQLLEIFLEEQPLLRRPDEGLREGGDQPGLESSSDQLLERVAIVALRRQQERGLRGALERVVVVADVLRRELRRERMPQHAERLQRRSDHPQAAVGAILASGLQHVDQQRRAIGELAEPDQPSRVRARVDVLIAEVTAYRAAQGLVGHHRQTASLFGVVRELADLGAGIDQERIDLGIEVPIEHAGVEEGLLAHPVPERARVRVALRLLRMQHAVEVRDLFLAEAGGAFRLHQLGQNVPQLFVHDPLKRSVRLEPRWCSSRSDRAASRRSALRDRRRTAACRPRANGVPPTRSRSPRRR